VATEVNFAQIEEEGEEHIRRVRATQDEVILFSLATPPTRQR